MKKSLALLIVLALSAAIAFASPFVASDPDPNHTRYRVRISQDGVTWGAWSEGQPQNQHLWFDFGQIAPGTYSGEAQALLIFSVTDTTTGTKTTVEEWSSSAPFSFTIPTGVRIIKIAK